jgi:4-diphosphocytidyl-2-C-methyl-D-erythritol kinase
MASDLAKLRNDLEPPAITLRPVIGAVLAALAAMPGCLLARMSGSGATCFGLFPNAAAAEAVARALMRPGWWCWGGLLQAC